jgi:hypothetical protein
MNLQQRVEDQQMKLQNHRPNYAAYALTCILFMPFFSGCVRRTITITTDPPQARVFLNDQEIGRSEVSTDFLWYGDYDVVIRKEGYETLQTHWTIKPPWYQWIPFDFFTEVLWPGWIHDQHCQHFALSPAATPTEEEVIERAEKTREEALGGSKN